MSIARGIIDIRQSIRRKPVGFNADILFVRCARQLFRTGRIWRDVTALFFHEASAVNQWVWPILLGGACLFPVAPGAAQPLNEASKLVASDAPAHFVYPSVELFGQDVALDRDTILVGAPDDGGRGLGSVYVFVRDETGEWTEQQKLLAGDGSAGDGFGHSVAMDGDTAIVGAPGDDDNGANSGSVYVFVRDAGGEWAEQQKLLSGDGAVEDRFGQSIAVDGNTLVVVAPRFGSSRAYVFARAGTGQWHEQTRLLGSDDVTSPVLSIALNGNTAVLGVPWDDDNGPQSGSAYVFVREEAGEWTEQDKLLARDAMADDYFGRAVALNGDTALIGALGDDDHGDDSGSVYAFVRDGTGQWTQRDKLHAADGTDQDLFGSDVAIDAYTAVIGATTGGGYGIPGSAYVFARDSGGTWVERAKLAASDASANFNDFGNAVALDAQTAVIGAPWDLVGIGSAYVFAFDDTDWDGISDAEDMCPLHPDPDPPKDTDGDGLWDSCDADADGDCVADTFDNCPTTPNCNYFGRDASMRFCSNPCSPSGEVGELARFVLDLCVRLPVNPHCFVDGCVWPPFFDTPEGDPRALLEGLATDQLDLVPGLKLLDAKRARLPAPYIGPFNTLPRSLQSILTTTLKGHFSPKEIELLFSASQQVDKNTPRGVEPIRAPMGPFALPNDLRRQVCSAVVSRFYTPNARDALKGYATCRQRYQAGAEQCQLDTNGDGVGDACE